MRIVCKTVVLLLFVAILSTWLSCAAFAQNASALRGIVTDPSGARLPHATIQLKSPAGEQTQTTDDNGQYAFTAIAPGRYDVEVTAQDFKADHRRDLNINGATTFNVQLALEGQNQVVTVQDAVETAVSTDPDANASATVL